MSQHHNDSSSPSELEQFATSTKNLLNLARGLAVSNPDDPDLQVLMQQTARILGVVRNPDSREE